MQDCVVIGGGPGGLAAALYLARFRLRCMVLDAGSSRASRIPRCRNFPGFPDGIPGVKLLDRMREQLSRYDIRPITTEALGLESTPDGFSVKTADNAYTARTVLLATGMRDVEPPFENRREHDQALSAGLLHYCPVCDGYEVSDKRVVVLGGGHHGAKEAMFLRGFTDSVDLVCPSGAHALSPEDRSALGRARITIVDGPVKRLRLEQGMLRYSIGEKTFGTEALYAAMGCQLHASLAETIGADVSKQGCVIVDAHQRTSVTNLYAVGDIVAGLDQIVTAVGQAAIAATAIRNDLDAELGRTWRR